MVESRDVPWRKSSYSDAGGNCVEVATLTGGGSAVRDSKSPAAGTLHLTAAAHTAWIAALKQGAFDAP